LQLSSASGDFKIGDVRVLIADVPWKKGVIHIVDQDVSWLRLPDDQVGCFPAGPGARPGVVARFHFPFVPPCVKMPSRCVARGA
jgi:hypothetical protein